MKLLRENEENILSQLLNENEESIQLSGNDYKLSELENLEKLGYLVFRHKELLRTNFFANVSITESGKQYFEDKEKYLQAKQEEEKKYKKAERIANIKYIITTSIAVIALVISIVGVCVNCR